MTQTPRAIRPLLTGLLLCAALGLSGCESSEEKAERYYQSALALLESGDEARAMVELRNVFQHDGFHKEARETYAGLLRDEGRQQEAYGQYLRLIEQYPDTVEVRRILAEMAIETGNWDEAERHGAAAIELDPENPRGRAIALVLEYRQAALDRDTAARDRLAGAATERLEAARADGLPDNRALVRIVIDNLVSGPDPEAALPVIERALENTPDSLDLHMMKLQLLARIEDLDGTGAQLERMIEVFPENREFQETLVNWYLGQGEIDTAEAYLRRLAGPETGPTPGHVSLVQMLQATRGPEAARAELERLIAANAGTGNGRLYSAMLAGMDFTAGERAAGIAAMRAALDGAEPGEQTRRLQVMLAGMLDQEGARDDARALVDQVLEQDRSDVAALKLRARWLIDGDRPGEAILALRSALDQDPRDSEALTLLAMAHERDGDIDLMGERLAMAVEVSDSGTAESLRYARFLLAQDRPQVAVTVLEEARRASPGDTDLLRALAEIHLRERSWPQAQAVVDALRRLDTPETRQSAVTLQAAILQGQDRTEDSLAVLEAQIDGNAGAGDRQSTRAVVQIVQARIRGGKVEDARAYLDEVLAEAPENQDLQLLNANLHALMGEMEQAEAGYRALIDRFPESELPVRLLLSLLSGNGRVDAMGTVLDAALERMPDSTNLLWYRASLLERAGEVEAAIGIYEQLYARDSGNTVIANNLASLITSHRQDPDSLERGFAIAKRLRGTKVPAFADTYGWIQHLRGNHDEALRYVELAAEELSQDPIVQYHLGRIHAALGQEDAARVALTRAIELAETRPLPQLEEARAALEGLGNG